MLCRSDCRKSYAGVGGNEDVSDRHSIEETGMKKGTKKMDRKDILLNKQRIVIKVGTSTITYEETGNINLEKLERFVPDSDQSEK